MGGGGQAHMYGNVSLEPLMKHDDNSDWVSGRDLEPIEMI